MTDEQVTSIPSFVPNSQGDFFNDTSFSESSAYLKPKITVVGVGGAGGNAVNNMIKSELKGVEFVVANADAQALMQSLCERRIQLGLDITKGLGAGARPDVGRAAAEEATEEAPAAEEEVEAEVQKEEDPFATFGEQIEADLDNNYLD